MKAWEKAVQVLGKQLPSKSVRYDPFLNYYFQSCQVNEGWIEPAVVDLFRPIFHSYSLSHQNEAEVSPRLFPGNGLRLG